MGEHEKYEKCRKMMVSCVTANQLANAVRWINLLVRELGGFSFHYAMLVMTIRGVMLERLGIVNQDITEIDWGPINKLQVMK